MTLGHPAPSSPSLTKALIWKALRLWEPLAGLGTEPDSVEAVASSPSRWQARLAPTGDAPEASLPALLARYLSAGPHDPWVATLCERMRYCFPDDPMPYAGSSAVDWRDLARRAGASGGLTLVLKVRPRTWARFLRPLIEIWAAGGGFRVAGRRAVSPVRMDVDLVPERTPAWIPKARDAAALLTACLRLYHLSCDVALTSDGAKLQDEDWAGGLDEINAVGRRSDLRAVITACSAASTSRPGHEDLRDLIHALYRAERTAPRGFVGLKFFRERLLLPGAPIERRKAVLAAAEKAGVVRIGSVQDGANGTPTVTVALDRAHPMVREDLAGAEGLPDPVTIPGEPLSATVIATRDAER